MVQADPEQTNIEPVHVLGADARRTRAAARTPPPGRELRSHSISRSTAPPAGSLPSNAAHDDGGCIVGDRRRP